MAQIWLDHDLGEVTGRVEDVMPVVDHIVGRSLDDAPVAVGTIVLHTSNPVGRANIDRALTRVGYRVVHVLAEDYLIAAPSPPAAVG